MERTYTVGETKQNCLLWLSIYTRPFNAARALKPICSAHGQPKLITHNNTRYHGSIAQHPPPLKRASNASASCSLGGPAGSAVPRFSAAPRYPGSECELVTASLCLAALSVPSVFAAVSSAPVSGAESSAVCSSTSSSSSSRHAVAAGATTAVAASTGGRRGPPAAGSP